ncbi:Branched-chain amino acid transport protein (AzlD) [Pelagimonas phthalicica]|uniref:Branched-chain amino acid transport protein (AzlD) n=1 Tax=Pelagimonas phthalicica TaxID=1037362 RepID=A0A238J6F5_9RHOB|nr:AzlD domain-containing protein [Pelagimonas phthalicica]TDS95135.1 branched-subunit amino acid transport protein [Pelagimonas phthalicica]SMX26341.1 Branched-chain amino acid transport protein (AzlD) [Pelagimonas phthalicica]
MIDKLDLWITIAALGVGSFGLRFLFLGLVGDRALPDWALRHLRYTGVAVLAALVTPLVVWPAATGGETDPARLMAAAVAVVTGYVSKNIYGALVAGAAVMVAAAYWPG